MRAYFGLSKLKKPGAFSSWLRSIAGRVVKETYRARARRRQVALADCEPADTARGHDDSPDPTLARAIAELPEVYRQVILMRYYGDLSCNEVSRQLEVPLGTVTKRLSRAYALLRESLRNYERPEASEMPS